MKQAETAAVARNAVIYARYSSHNQTEQSIEGQLRVCHEYAQREGFTIVGEYIDRAISGKTDDRPDFQRMVSDSRKRAFQYVIVYKLDRFARNRYDSAVYKHKLKQNGVKVVSAMENIGDNPEGIILEAVLEASAEYYSLELAQKIKRGKRESAMKGQFNGGTPPFGYRSVDRRLVIDEAKAPFVKRAFEQYAAGVPKKRIVAELNAAGLRNRNGKPFGHTALQVALQNEKYIGIQRFSDIVIEDACPALVDRETFDKVQERIKQNRREGGKNKAKMEYLLTGKAFCGYCGSTITGVSSKGRHNEPHYYYACRNRRLGNGCKKAYEKKDFLEWYVVEQTVEYVLTPSRIQEIAAAVVAEYDREFNDTRIKELERQIARLERDIDKLTDSILDVPKSAWAGIGQKIETATMQKNDLEIDLSKLRIANKIRYTESDIVVWLKSFCKGDLFDMEFRRRIIDTFINSVYLYDDRVIVFYNIRGGKQVSYIDMLDATEGFPGLDDEPAPGDSGESPDAKEKPDTTSGVRLLNASHLLGGGDVFPQLPHPAYEVHCHLVVDIDDLRHVVAAVHPSDILVAETEGLLQRHPALHTEAGEHGGGDHKVVAQVGHRVVGELAHPLHVLKGPPAAIFLHRVNEARRHRAVEQKFLPRLPVAGDFALLLQKNGLPAWLSVHRGTSLKFWHKYIINLTFWQETVWRFIRKSRRKTVIVSKFGHGFDIC